MELTFAPTPGSPDLSADIQNMIRTAQSPELMQAIGAGLQFLWQRAFDEPDLRPAPWPARKVVAAHPLLKLTGHFWRSPRVATYSASHVTVASDVPYAAIHQFGGAVATRYRGYNLDGPVKAAKQSYAQIPARPSFPIFASGKLTPRAETEIGPIIDAFTAGWTPGGA